MTWRDRFALKLCRLISRIANHRFEIHVVLFEKGKQ